MELYPLRFEPIFRSMPWGGTRLRAALRHPDDAAPIGEAWVLSDVDGALSRIVNGPLAGQTLRDVCAAHPAAVFGPAAPADGRFPLLLKLLDARQELSVQVHPDDGQAVQLKGAGQRGKTEAWVILDAHPATSQIYAGFKPGLTAGDFRTALGAGTTPETLHRFVPVVGDCVFLPAGTVHAIGADILLFEVQQTSDITYRLYDWDRKDANGNLRELHIDHGLLCADFARGPCAAVVPARCVTTGREALVECPQFTLHRSINPRAVGRAGVPTAVVCVAGTGTLAGEPIQWGDVVLLPACVGTAAVTGELTLLECGLVAG